MQLTGYVQASEPGIVQLWVGMFGCTSPPALQVFIDDKLAAPTTPLTLYPIRDLETDAAGNPANYQSVVRFTVPKGADPHQIRLDADGQTYALTTTSLPESVPTLLDGSFNILLSSCYSQPEDDHGLLGTIVSQIKVKPDLTLLSGDQVYLDLPLDQSVPSANPDRARMFAKKYEVNWLSGALRVPGLQSVLERAPVVCIPDDHEFWNNYPFRQVQLPDTLSTPSRKLLGDTARALYEDYQIGGEPSVAGGATRLDVAPLKMLFVDMRCDRDADFNKLMSDKSAAALATWVQDLLDAQAANQPAVGVLASGQALFIDAPNAFSKHLADAEMANYAQFATVQNAITTLAGKGIPVVYMTGDVHWGRVACGTDNQTGTVLYEVISSPSRLIRVPGIDAVKDTANKIKGIFGAGVSWPHHSPPATPPSKFGPNARFSVTEQYGQRGDQVAILSFTRVGGGVDMQVTYYGISSDKSLSQSRTTPRFELRVR